MTIYFDLDGPILDVSERYFRVHRDIVGEGHSVSVTKSVFWTLKRQRLRIADLVARIAPGVDETSYLRRWRELIEEPHYLAHDVLVPGAVAVLRGLCERHSLVLVTLRVNRCALEWELHAKGLCGLFQEILSGPANMIPPWKVKKRLILRGPPAAPRESVILGDTEADILAGQALGLTTVAAVNGIRTREQLETLQPDFIIDDITSFPMLLAGSG